MGVILRDYKNYYKATVIKTTWEEEQKRVDEDLHLDAYVGERCTCKLKLERPTRG